MIGLVIAAHGPLAKALVEAAEFIIGQRIERVRALAVAPGVSPEDLKEALQGALKEVDDGDGVLILADMFGGSPSDMAISFLEQNRVEVLTGVNLPMILEVVLRRTKVTELKKLAGEAEKKALSSIALAGRILSP